MHDEFMQKCTLSRWTGGHRACRWCDNALPKRRVRWCSDDCVNEAIRNHWWSASRSAARKRDDFRCVRCPPDAKQHGLGRGGLQVHHRDEHAKGRHSKTSCCHHLDRLETLCHVHHVEQHTGEATKRARANRAAQLTIGEEAAA